MKKPYQIRILAKSLTHSLEMVNKEGLRPSGVGSKAYHLRRIKELSKIISENSHLLDVYLHKKLPV